MASRLRLHWISFPCRVVACHVSCRDTILVSRVVSCHDITTQQSYFVTAANTVCRVFRYQSPVLCFNLKHQQLRLISVLWLCFIYEIGCSATFCATVLQHCLQEPPNNMES